LIWHFRTMNVWRTQRRGTLHVEPGIWKRPVAGLFCAGRRVIAGLSRQWRRMPAVLVRCLKENVLVGTHTHTIQ
jgi:hypothetical protein